MSHVTQTDKDISYNSVINWIINFVFKIETKIFSELKDIGIEYS